MVSEHLHNTQKDPAVYATSNGVPYPNHPYGSQTAGPGGPLLLQDFNLIDDLSHFDRERIPERVVHAKGGGAHGYFELTDSLSDLTYARPFQSVGYKCPISIRFSTVGGERGTPDTLRDPRGFSIKFKTDIGNMDWVFNNTPVFFIRDPIKFPKFIHTQKRDPSTHLNQNTDSTHTWDYYVLNPESIHQVTYMFGRRGIPKSWAEMHGYSGHTFKFINDKDELTYVQIHIKADGGFPTLSNDEGAKLAGSSPEHNIKDLYDRIAAGKYPGYTTYVQTMTAKQAEEFKYSINDLTKVWPHDQFPLRKFGRIVLDKNPVNYHDEIEQLAFSPAHLVPGVEASNDPVLQSRLYSYSDTHRHRLGANYQQLPVNKPRTFEQNSGCPFLAGNFQRDGAASIDGQGFRPNYLSSILPLNSVSNDPKTFTNGLPQVEDAKYVGVVQAKDTDKYTILQKERAKRAHEEAIWLKSYDYISGIDELDFEQPRKLYQDVFTSDEKKEFVEAVVGHASSISIPRIKERVPLYFGLLDADLGKKIADGLGVKFQHLNLQEYVKEVGIAPAN
ncbi:catalase-domain-containing protein [Suhomyces tanzawaensis NRRL Y-17324]|uniref:Catalase T n=1 Tax=Suhomyces tanzawaensis NRRL Y-17324 TaxID=984487 RepID=A0A1E4SBL1_9ASCO|nr:catalase-domain-containing protein [Suhomyces tanzawaensis NRRL Y-17324]ODV76889.1 catalase-domain-containing protein [Suhomyces tanzawaensis NRRL Y-17324]